MFAHDFVTLADVMRHVTFDRDMLASLAAGRRPEQVPLSLDECGEAVFLTAAAPMTRAVFIARAPYVRQAQADFAEAIAQEARPPRYLIFDALPAGAVELRTLCVFEELNPAELCELFGHACTYYDMAEHMRRLAAIYSTARERQAVIQ